jgi:UDP-N-acetylglucosamine 1-carboxyvinyltransferase
MQKTEENISKTYQQKIGYFIKSLRQRKGLTQKEFSKILNTSQSAVARIENGGQNLTTSELLKISDVLNRKIISISDSIDFEIQGGKKLSGTINTNTSKNGALALMSASLLNKGVTIIRDVPRIEEVNRIIEMFELVGVSVRWLNQDDLEIRTPKKFKVENLINESAQKIRSGLMLIGPLLHFEKSFKMSHSGGCKMGMRTIAAHKYGLEKLGAKIDSKTDFYEIKSGKLKGAEVVMYETGDTATINVLLAAALIPEKTIIKFASANYQVQDVCFFLEKLGVKINGIGTTTLEIIGVKEINTYIEHFVSEDPIESMMFIAAAIVTESKLKIKRCPIDFLDLELLKLEKMGLNYQKSETYFSKNEKTKLVDLTILPSKLVALDDKISAQPYPGINTDNLPFFVPICAMAEGSTLIHDWMWENRAIYFTELNRLNAKIDLADPHRVFVHGKIHWRPAQVVCPPALRPAMIILIGMLGAKGKSVLRNVYTIQRGYEEIAERLNSVGADIKIMSNI